MTAAEVWGQQLSFTDSQDYPGLHTTVLQDGRIAMTWRESGGVIKAQTLNVDGTLNGPIITVYASASATASSPKIVTLADGNFAISYWTYNPTDNVDGINVAIYNPSGVQQSNNPIHTMRHESYTG